MTALTITAKGQVTLKQELLNHLGVGPGEKIEADKLPDGRIVVRAAAPTGSMTDFVGCLSQPRGPKLAIEEMNRIASREWARLGPVKPESAQPETDQSRTRQARRGQDR